MDRSARGISEALGFIFSLAVLVTFIFGGLYVGVGFFSDGADAAQEEQATFTGERIAATIEAVDREVRATDGDGEIRDTAQSPDRIGGDTYHIEIESTESGGIITIGIEGGDMEITREFTTQTDVEETRLSGGPVEVVREEGADELTFNT